MQEPRVELVTVYDTIGLLKDQEKLAYFEYRGKAFRGHLEFLPALYHHFKNHTG